MRKQQRLIWAVMASSIVFAPQAAFAQYGLSASSNTNASVYTPNGYVSDPHSDSHVGVVGPVGSGAGSYLNPYIYIQAGGSAKATANYNVLHAEAIGSGEDASGNAIGGANWYDTLTVSSSTLPLNTPVTLLATAHYTGTLNVYYYDSLNAGFMSYGNAAATFASYVGSVALPYSTSVGFTNGVGNGGKPSDTIDKTMQQSITTYVGATLPISAEMDVSGNGTSNAFKVTVIGSGTADATFNVQSQTAGVTLVYASASATPAPGALMVALLGAVPGIALLRRRRKHRVRRAKRETHDKQRKPSSM